MNDSQMTDHQTQYRRRRGRSCRSRSPADAVVSCPSRRGRFRPWRRGGLSRPHAPEWACRPPAGRSPGSRPPAASHTPLCSRRGRGRATAVPGSERSCRRARRSPAAAQRRRRETISAGGKSPLAGSAHRRSPTRSLVICLCALLPPVHNPTQPSVAAVVSYSIIRTFTTKISK